MKKVLTLILVIALISSFATIIHGENYGTKIEDITENTIPIISNTKLTYNSLTPINFNNITETILANDDVSYTLVFYIFDTGENQVVSDSAKGFRANINVNSITTGEYISNEINS